MGLIVPAVTSGVTFVRAIWCSLTVKARAPKNRAGALVLCATAGYFILGGGLAVVWIETSYRDGSTFVSLYSHLYRYPLFFGWITIPLLWKPIDYILSTPTLEVAKLKVAVIGLLLVGGLVFIINDLRSQNVAPFELKAAILETDPTLSTHFTQGERSPADKIAYQRRMLETIKNPSNWSSARYLHYLAIFVQVLNLLCIGFVAMALIVDRTSDDFCDSSDFKLALAHCSLAGLLSYLWALMRVAFIYQKPNYFPDISNPVSEAVIIAAFVITTLVIMAGLIFWVGDRLVAIAGVLAGVSSVLSIVKAQYLLLFFGVQAETKSYWTILSGIGIFAMFVTLAKMIKKKPSPSGALAPANEARQETRNHQRPTQNNRRNSKVEGLLRR